MGVAEEPAVPPTPKGGQTAASGDQMELDLDEGEPPYNPRWSLASPNGSAARKPFSVMRLALQIPSGNGKSPGTPQYGQVIIKTLGIAWQVSL